MTTSTKDSLNTIPSVTKPVILVTGAAGYVGSHCLIELLNNNYDVVAIDNCVNAVEADDCQVGEMPESLRRVEGITGQQILQYYKMDINDRNELNEIFTRHSFTAVMHFASLKAVGESCTVPLRYYNNNVGGTVILLEVMRQHSVKKIIFSSSATVYGTPEYLPIDEQHPTGRNCTNPYGKTKYFIEEILKDLCHSEKGWSVTSLRYFNPVGAHYSGKIGEDPQGIPNNLMPYIAQVAVGRQSFLRVFGSDFKTHDGTGVRDYIHIMDLAAGHVITLKKMLDEQWTGWHVFNLGAGTGYSVLNVITAFEEATGVKVPYKLCDRRSGDVDQLWADIRKASRELGWTPKRSLTDMCADSWRWQSANPMGYRTSTKNNVNSLNEDDDQHEYHNLTNGTKMNTTNKLGANPISIAEKVVGKYGKGLTSFEVNNNDEDVAAFQ